MEKLLKNWINYSLANFAIDVLQFSPYIFWILEFHNVESNLIIYTFNNDVLHCPNSYLVFFDLFLP